MKMNTPLEVLGAAKAGYLSLADAGAHESLKSIIAGALRKPRVVMPK